MHPFASTFLGATLVLSATACVVNRTGLQVGEGGTALSDGGRPDSDFEADAFADELGSDDSGTNDLSRDDLGSADLGLDSCVDLGFRNHRSCRELNDDPCLPPLTSGYFEIDVDGAGGRPPVEVYCDMSIAGGGWTLVGRTDNTDEPFGWGTTFGSVRVDNDPYSLGLGPALVFDEVLVGKRAAGKDWGANSVYRFAVTANFVNAYAASAYAIPAIITERGACTPAGGPSVLRYTGYTSEDHDFFFRDTTAFDATYGMRAAGFSLDDGACEVSGTLDRQSGMIMVR